MSQRELTPEERERVVALALDLARAGRGDELLEFVHHGLPIDVVDGHGNTLLMLAAYHGHSDIVRRLLAAGADPNLRNGRDQSVVAGALFKGEREIVRLLVEAGSDLDAGTPTARQAAEMFGQQALLDG